MKTRVALRGGVPARRRERRVRPPARHRVPDRRRHPRLRGRHHRDGQGSRNRLARRDADAPAPARSPRGLARARRASRRPAEGALLRVAATGASSAPAKSRTTTLGEPRLVSTAPGGAKSSRRWPKRSSREFLIAVFAPNDTLEPIREKIELGERLDFEDGLALLESDDLLGPRRARDLARQARGGTGRGLLRPEPVREPDRTCAA